MFRDDDAKTANGVFAQISASPYDIVGQFASRPDRSADERSSRADEARKFLDDQGYTTEEWSTWVRTTSGVPTTLAPLGPEITRALLEHGYMLTMVNMYVLYGLGELRPVDRTRFGRLVKGASA
jgi:hypothetical protein